MDVQTVLDNYRIFMERLSHFPPDIAGAIASTLAMSAEQVTIDNVWQTFESYAREIAHYLPGAAGIIAADLTAAVYPGGGGGLPPGSFVLKAGDTMQGPLILAADPVVPFEAATKLYVDTLFAGGQRLIGIIDASTGDVRYLAGSGFPNGPLVPADVAGAGAYVICEAAGNIPEPLLVGDWLVSDGIDWIRLNVGTAVITAGAVVVIPPILGANNVQDALAALDAAKVNRAGDTMTGLLSIRVPGGGQNQLDIGAGSNTPNSTSAVRLFNTLSNNGFSIVMASGGVAPDQTGLTIHRNVFGGDVTLLHMPPVAQRVELLGPRTLSGDPVDPDDLVRKAYVDNLAAQISPLYVLKAGDTMTGDLFITDPTQGTGEIRLAADGDSARIRLRKNAAAQWMIDTDETHYRIINYTPNGATGRVNFEIIGNQNRTIMTKPQTTTDPVDDDDLVRKAALDGALNLKVNRAGDTMTGMLTFTGGGVQIIHPAEAVIRLSAPDAAFISFRRGGLLLEPQWILGTQHIRPQHQDNFALVRFTTPGDISSADVPLEIDYATGDTIGNRFRTLALDPQDDDELTSKLYVDTAIATGLPPLTQVLVGVINAATGQCRYSPITGFPDGPLVPADQVNGGDYLICEAPGPIPEPMDTGDWLISDGNNWIVLQVGTHDLAASSVTVIPAVAGADNVQDALTNLQLQKLDNTTADARYLRLIGGTLTGALVVSGQNLVSRLVTTSDAARASLAFGTGNNNHFALFRNNGATSLHLVRFPTDGGAETEVLNVNRATGNITLSAPSMLTLSGAPTVPLHAATKAYVDTAAALKNWTTGAAYATGDTFVYDNRGFIAITPIPNAPATPDFTTIRPIGYGQSGYWHGNVTITNWEVDSWVLIATVPAYGTYSLQVTDLHNQNDSTLIATIATGYNTATCTVLGYTHQGTGSWKAIRLSATGNGAAVRIEFQVAIRSGTPNVKVLVAGETRGTTANQVTIPMPLAASLTNQGGTTRALIVDLGSSQLAIGGDTEITPGYSSAGAATNGRLRFPHTTTRTTGNLDDGSVSVRRHGRGLNLVGAVTEAGETSRRFITGWGHFTLQGGDGIEMGSAVASGPTDLTQHLALWGGGTPTANGFGLCVTGGTLNLVAGTTGTTNQIDFHVGAATQLARLFNSGLRLYGNRNFYCDQADNTGIAFFDGGWMYRKTGGRLTIRCTTGNAQPQIENTNGTGGRDIIDTVNGDARYVRLGAGAGNPTVLTAVNLAARFQRVRSEGADAGVGNDPPVLRANSNSIHNSNANYASPVFLPALNYQVGGEAFFYESDATFNTTIRNTRTSMPGDLTLIQGNTAVFIKNNSTNLYDFVAIVPNGLLGATNKFNSFANSFALPTNRGTNGQWLVSNGAGGTSWTSGLATADATAFATADALAAANEKIAQLESRLAALEEEPPE